MTLSLLLLLFVRLSAPDSSDPQPAPLVAISFAIVAVLDEPLRELSPCAFCANQSVVLAGDNGAFLYQEGGSLISVPSPRGEMRAVATIESKNFVYSVVFESKSATSKVFEGAKELFAIPSAFQESCLVRVSSTTMAWLTSSISKARGGGAFLLTPGNRRMTQMARGVRRPAGAFARDGQVFFADNAPRDGTYKLFNFSWDAETPVDFGFPPRRRPPLLQKSATVAPFFDTRLEGLLLFRRAHGRLRVLGKRGDGADLSENGDVRSNLIGEPPCRFLSSASFGAKNLILCLRNHDETLLLSV